MILRNNLIKLGVLTIAAISIASCQKMKRPALGNYPEDQNVTPATELRFYVPFDSTTDADKQINIRFKDSISNYPCFFPDNSISAIAGAHGTAYYSNSGKFLTYYNTNDFVATAQSFTVAFWEKRNGHPDGDAQFPFAIPSTNGYWAGAAMFALFDHQGAGATDDSAVVKFDCVDKNLGDNWFVWDGAHRIRGIQDNNWHHVAFVYDATTSVMKLYVDGVANAWTQQWGTHGPANMDAGKAAGFNLGGRPIENLGWGKSWYGGIDQFRMYNKALSAAEIQALVTNKL